MIKTRVIKRRDFTSPATGAWMNAIEEKFQVSDIDPYHRFYSVKENIYHIFEESADGMGDVWLHLIVGPERALLIDTGFGIGDLKGLVNELTGGKELLVANTHQGPDHLMGNYQFDKVYCHEYCAECVPGKMHPGVWDYLTDENGKGIWYDFDPKDIIGYKEYEVVPVKDGYIFDLGGGHTVELFHTGGHAPGGASFLDRKNRILFTGQFHTNYTAIGGNLPHAAEWGTVKGFKRSLTRIAEHLDEFDYVMPAHELQWVKPSFITDFITLCDMVIEDPDSYDFTIPNAKGQLVRYKAYASASLRYTPEVVN